MQFDRPAGIGLRLCSVSDLVSFILRYLTKVILETRPYLAGSKDIPNRCHLILIPGTLLSQWFDELRILFMPGYVDIFVYPTSAEGRAMFWAEDGPFHLSRHALYNRIILAPHSVSTFPPMFSFTLINLTP